MKNNIKVKKRFKEYIIWPLATIIVFLALTVALIPFSYYAVLIAIIFTIAYSFFAISFHFVHRNKIVYDIVEFAEKYSKIQSEFINDFDLPYGMIDGYGNLLWMNKRLEEITGEQLKESRDFLAEFSEITTDTLELEEDIELSIIYNERNYSIQLKKIENPENGEWDNLIELDSDRPYLVAVYLFDKTEINKLAKENIEQEMVCGLIYLDNYEEALESVEDVRQSLLIAFIDRKINSYFLAIDGIVRKIEKDKYFIAFKRKHIAQMQSSKFEVLDDVKEINIGNDRPVTISIGIGLGGSGYNQNSEFSRNAIDLALGRGGDQAVVKEGEKIYYYGGKSKSVEKNTKVKARVKAQALKEIILSKDRVIVMGHRIGDIDSFGASVGIYRAAKEHGKKAQIIVNELTTTVRPIIEMFTSDEEYEEDIFISNSEAVEVVDDNTVVIIVDVGKPELLECPELLDLSKTIVVLDHHRQGTSTIENAVLSYIEPYASSTSEMVTEILQYVAGTIKLKKVEAEALYAGILIDTNYFSNNTGVRTFEAAAYLKRMGADITRVKELFRDDLSDFKAKAAAIIKAEVFEEVFAIADCPSEGITSPTVLVAQTANDLLSINNIKASFVLTDYNNKIYISARSAGELNVQLIMERIGGGGHMNTAGAQLSNCSVEEGKNIVKETVRKMIEEGDL